MPSSFNRIFSPFVMKHQKEVRRASRGFTHCHLLLLLRSLHLHRHEHEPGGGGSQMEEGGRRIHRPCHQSQSRSRYSLHLHTTAAPASLHQSEQFFLQKIQFLGFHHLRRQWESKVATNLGESESPSPTWCLSSLRASHVEPSHQLYVETCTS
jgi:hypothetical protein